MAYPQGPPPQYGSGRGAYGDPAYGAPGGGYGPPQVEHPQGTVVLVLGILAIVACQILGPFAWVMGNRAMKEIDATPGRYSNRGLVNAGRICGIVGSVLLGVYLVAGILYVIVLVAVVAGSGST